MQDSRSRLPLQMLFSEVTPLTLSLCANHAYHVVAVVGFCECRENERRSRRSNEEDTHTQRCMYTICTTKQKTEENRSKEHERAKRCSHNRRNASRAYIVITNLVVCLSSWKLLSFLLIAEALLRFLEPVLVILRPFHPCSPSHSTHTHARTNLLTLSPSAKQKETPVKLIGATGP